MPLTPLDRIINAALLAAEGGVMDRLEEIRKWPDKLRRYGLGPTAADMAELLQRHDALLAEVGRLKGRSCTCCWCGEECGVLMALKTHSSACPKHPLMAEVGRLQGLLDDAAKPLLDETDLVAFYKDRMKEHRDNAIASRKRAEAAEKEVGRLREVANAATRWRKAIEANALSWSQEGLSHVLTEGRAIYAALDALSPQPEKE